METYTNIKIEMENNTQTKAAVEMIKTSISDSKWFKDDERNVGRFIEDFAISENTIIVDYSCSLDSWEYENLILMVYKVTAAINDVKSFKAISHFVCCNDGYEAYCDANYINGTLTIEYCASYDFSGSCDECGDFVVNWEDYDPEETYICPECGEVLTEERMFPDGLPEVEISSYEI